MARFFKDARTVYFKPSGVANDSFDEKFFREPVLWKLLLLTALAYIVWSGKISIVLDPRLTEEFTGHTFTPNPVAASLSGQVAVNTAPKEALQPQQAVWVELPAGNLNNLTFAIDPGFGQRNGIASQEAEKRFAVCRDYLSRFAPVAVAEMRKFGIPASITLAQGLLESDAGESKLAAKSNNHFGIKCFSKSCRPGHCLNFEDNSHKDFFLKFGNAWSSFRAHSELLRNGDAYRSLFDLPATDYQGWAYGLAKAGYAADNQYAEKLIAIIQSLKLDSYDVP